VPVIVDEILAIESVATALVMPADAPVSWNCTGTVLPSLNTELSSALIGCKIPDHAYRTWTWNDPVALLPWASVAVQVTVVGPTGNVEPDGGLHVTGRGPSTRSIAFAANVTTAPLGPVASAVTLAGTVSAGGVVSTTVTVKLALAVLPAISLAAQVTVVVPRWSVEPEGGVHAKVATPTSSVADAL